MPALIWANLHETCVFVSPFLPLLNCIFSSCAEAVIILLSVLRLTRRASAPDKYDDTAKINIEGQVVRERTVVSVRDTKEHHSSTKYLGYLSGRRITRLSCLFYVEGILYPFNIEHSKYPPLDYLICFYQFCLRMFFQLPCLVVVVFLFIRTFVTDNLSLTASLVINWRCVCCTSHGPSHDASSPSICFLSLLSHCYPS